MPLTAWGSLVERLVFVNLTITGVESSCTESRRCLGKQDMSGWDTEVSILSRGTRCSLSAHLPSAWHVCAQKASHTELRGRTEQVCQVPEQKGAGAAGAPGDELRRGRGVGGKRSSAGSSRPQ